MVNRLKQTIAYSRFTGVKSRPENNNHRYEFSNDRQKLLSSITIRTPILKNMVISERIGVVDANVPFTLGFNLLDKYKLTVRNIRNVFVYHDLNHIDPLCGKQRHIFLEWGSSNSMLYKYSELHKLHRNFFLHPNSEKLYNLITLARSWEINSNTKKVSKSFFRDVQHVKNLISLQYYSKFLFY